MKVFLNFFVIFFALFSFGSLTRKIFLPALENILYVFRYGLSVALPRAILAVPGHMGFAVFMGIFYGRAKRCLSRGNGFGRRMNLSLGYLFPVLLHGIFDTCCMLGTESAVLTFLGFVAAMYLIVYCLLRRESRTDGPV